MVAGFACESLVSANFSKATRPGTRTHQEEREERPTSRNRKQSDVHRVPDRVRSRVPGEPEFDGGPDYATEVEKRPKDSEVAALQGRCGVGESQAALRRPSDYLQALEAVRKMRRIRKRTLTGEQRRDRGLHR